MELRKVKRSSKLDKSEWCSMVVWILKLLTDYSVPAQRWFQWKRWSTWMCYIWALNHVHVKKTSPTFYYGIAVELSKLYYWMMNGRIRYPRYYHGDDSKTSDWNYERRRKRVSEWKPMSTTSFLMENFSKHYLPQPEVFSGAQTFFVLLSLNKLCTCTNELNLLEFSNRHSVQLNCHFGVGLFHDLHILFHWTLHEILANVLPLQVHVNE